MSNIDELFKKEFEDYSVEPPAGLENVILKKFAFKNFFRFHLLNPNIYYLSALLAGAGYFGVTISQTNTYKAQSAKSSVVSSVALRQVSADIPDSTVLQSDNQFVIPTEETQKSSSASDNIENNKSENLISITNPDSSVDKSFKDFSSRFSTSVKSGCAPLRVDFINSSKNAEYCIWNFGNGQSSYDYNASAIYDTPGTYIVSLKVVNGERAGLFVDTVKVFAGVKAKISLRVVNEKRLAVLSAVNCTGADVYNWSFGDAGSSAAISLNHQYKTSGTYSIRLIAKNSFCSDTAYTSVSLTAPEYSLTFPNAFYASLSGYSGGTYSAGKKPVTVFYPGGDIDKIENYKLTVYNRSGKEIFSSEDINIGWDGYYHNELLPAGVYVYKVVYTFINGETMQQGGNITLLVK